MNTLLISASVLLCLLFIFSMKPASEVLCRLICGFFSLLLLNYAAGFLNFQPIGINIFSAIIAGMLDAPGCLLLLFIARFL